MTLNLSAKDRQTASLALGRILRMGSRPEQPGDAAEYWRCRNIIMDIVEGAGFVYRDMAPDYGRDRLKGAAGDF